MKRILLNALCFGVIAVGSTQLSAQQSGFDEPGTAIGGETNYQTCMRECRADDHSFTYCNGECKSLG